MLNSTSSFIALEEELKSRFISNISHELRTPASIIYCAIRNIETDLKEENIVIPEKSSDYFETIRKNVDRLLKLFDNMLEITNIRAGLLDINLMVCNVVNLVEDINFSVSEYLRKYNVSMIFDTEIEERYLNIDPKIIERVILNLISNAIKYSRDNIMLEVFIKVYEYSDKVCISIRDNGIGIAKAKLSEIFGIFNQSSNCMTKNSEGSGTGLCLVKLLLGMLDADIKVNSKLGSGTEFIIELPINRQIDFDPYDENNIRDYFVKKENIDKEFSDIDLDNKLDLCNI